MGEKGYDAGSAESAVRGAVVTNLVAGVWTE